MSDYRTILVTTDLSDRALAGVEEGRRLAERLNSDILLTYVVEDRLPPAIEAAGDRDAILERHRAAAEQSCRELIAERLAGCEVELVVAIGTPHAEIVELARHREADLIVIATHGYGTVGQLLFGSTAERVVKGAPCPVLVVRSPEK